MSDTEDLNDGPGPDDLRNLIVDFGRHLKAKNLAEDTIDSYVDIATDFVDYLVANGLPTDAPDVTNRHLDRYFADMRDRTNKRTGEPLSAAYVAKFYRSLQQYFRWLDEIEDIIATSPFVKTKPPAIPDQKVPILTEPQLRLLLATTKGKTFENVRDRALILLFIDTGCRCGEIAPLQIENKAKREAGNFDFDVDVVQVLGKGRRGRAVPFGAVTGEALRRYLRARARHAHASRSDAAWLGRQGPLTEWGIRHMLDRRAADAGIPNIHPHLFRHTFAHRWLAEGGQENDLMRLAGWKSREMVAKYGASGADERAHSAHRKANLIDRL